MLEGFFINKPHEIVIIGGGAGGLELATTLGNKLGKKKLANITLVDCNLTHIWKPLWHELAAGTLTSNEDELNYFIHAYRHDFKFQWGSFVGLDQINKKIFISEIGDKENKTILPERSLKYDTLIVAIGSQSNDFNVPGVKEHCFFLDSIQDCRTFQEEFLHHLMSLQQLPGKKLNIAIIGGGATGVELAAELQFASLQALEYQKKEKEYSFSSIQISIIESSNRLLPSLTNKISKITLEELERRGISVFLNEKVSKITDEKIFTKSNLVLPADLKIWAAGIQAPSILKNVGFKTNEKNQILVNQNMEYIDDEDIFALGDCAACPQENNKELVPPRAQAAHQEAKILARSLIRKVKNKKPLKYVYHDYGSLISISHSRTIGNLMGGLLGNIMLEGKIARFAYLFLYRKHQAALYGWSRVILLFLANLLTSRLKPRLKLH